MICVVCGARMHEVDARCDDRYGYPGEFGLHRCTACRHMQLAAEMRPEVIENLYTKYYPRSHRSLDDWSPGAEMSRLKGWWRGAQSSAALWVPRNVRVLDIGCGFGESLGYHRNRGCDAHGVEADANILRVAERYGLQVRHGLFDPGNYEDESFDVVTMDQVVEHLAQPKKVLQGVRQVLKPNGKLILSTPNAHGWGARLFGRRWIHWHAPYHLQFFSQASMRRAAEDAGFALERHVTVTPTAWLGFQWAHLVTYPVAGRPSAFWLPKLPRTTGQRIALRLLGYLDRLGVNAVLTRLADALGAGDNSVYVFRKQGA